MVKTTYIVLVVGHIERYGGGLQGEYSNHWVARCSSLVWQAISAIDVNVGSSQQLFRKKRDSGIPELM